MHPDDVLVILLAALAAGAPSLLIWLRASRRTHDLGGLLTTSPGTSGP